MVVKFSVYLNRHVFVMQLIICVHKTFTVRSNSWDSLICKRTAKSQICMCVVKNFAAQFHDSVSSVTKTRLFKYTENFTSKQ